MKKKVLSYVALSSALLTAAPLLGNVTANAATTNNNTTSSSAKVSSSSSSSKESSKVSASVKSSSAISSSKTADKKAARSAVRANNFAEVNENDVQEDNGAVGGVIDSQSINAYMDVIKAGDLDTSMNPITSSVMNSYNKNTVVVPNLLGGDFSAAPGGPAHSGMWQVYYKGHPFTGYDLADGLFFNNGFAYKMSAPKNAQQLENQTIANMHKSGIRLSNGQTIRTYGYNHYVANVNARTLPKTGESNSIVSLLKALF